MPIDTRFDALDDDQWSGFAEAWLAQLDDASEAAVDDMSRRVTYMMFMARPEHLWKFILLACEYATTDWHLANIAAGPVERLLGHDGETFIQPVEDRANADRRFTKMLTGVRRYTMSDPVWDRLQSVQTASEARLARRLRIESHDRFLKLEEEHRDRLKEALRQRRGEA